MIAKYNDFLINRLQSKSEGGFPIRYMPELAKPFQEHLVEWGADMGRCAMLAGCGLGKSLMELTLAHNAVLSENKPALLATPIAVGRQMVDVEAAKFGIPAQRTRDGKITSEKTIFVTNYEQLHKYNPDDFCCFVGDESSCLKDAKSETKKTVTEFARRIKYRFLATATAAPNDYWEIGTTSEVLGLLGWRDMITTFFRQVESGGRRWSHEYGTKYRFRGHAQEPFWQWVCSFARALRKPSDLGFDDTGYDLPPLIENNLIVDTEYCRPGQLIPSAAVGRQEELAERRNTIVQRCEKAAEVHGSGSGPCVLWCELNPEGDMLTKMIPGAVQVSGSMSDDQKEETLMAFTSGQIETLVTKPKMAGFGLNWQHCCRTISFPSHSFERDYQLVRRFYRFGQCNPVEVTRIVSSGESRILESLDRKAKQADRMFSSIVTHMNNSLELLSKDVFTTKAEVPSW